MIFYDHLIVIEEITAILDQHDLSRKEKSELLNLIDQTLHHHILDEILSLLPEPYHGEFMTRFHAHPDDKTLLFFLRDRSGTDMDKAIVKRADEVKKKLIKTILKSRLGKKQ